MPKSLTPKRLPGRNPLRAAAGTSTNMAFSEPPLSPRPSRDRRRSRGAAPARKRRLCRNGPNCARRSRDSSSRGADLARRRSHPRRVPRRAQRYPRISRPTQHPTVFHRLKAGGRRWSAGITLATSRRGRRPGRRIGYGSANPMPHRDHEPALRAVIPVQLRTLRLHRARESPAPTNAASIGLLEKSASSVKAMAAYLCINGMWQDHLLYARTKDRARPDPPQPSERGMRSHPSAFGLPGLCCYNIWYIRGGRFHGRPGNRTRHGSGAACAEQLPA